GLISYCALLIAATGLFWKGMEKFPLPRRFGERVRVRGILDSNFKSYILTACAGIMIGTFFINAIVENSHLTELALVLGIGLAAYNITKN
ncbi:MAG: hypothetical protein HZA14_00860, partial [Nitrospirae bacterium]|nr:hypothetical protein [Nitrospirota bacterium]